MIAFGKTLRDAREARGFTVRQLAEATHMAPSTIEELEREDFSRIAAPIYGRGFVKLYCEAVGLDPKPLVAEFMDIFNGNHDIGIKERPVAAAPEPPPAPEPAAPAEDPFPPAAPAAPKPPPAPRQTDFLQPEPDLPPPSADPLPPPEAEPAFSRYATPFCQRSDRLRLPPSVWRIGILAVVAFAALVGIGYGVRALYRATSSAPAEEREEPPTAGRAEPGQAEPKASKPETRARTPQKIPALYID